jgi:hypothetical protein
MACRAILGFGLLAAICGLTCPAPCAAQFPLVPNRCSVPPVAEDHAPHRKVIIDSIRFDGPIHVADTEVAQIVAEANQHDLDAATSNWVEELAEIGLRGAWQDQGYFGVMATAATQSLGGDSSEERFLIKAHMDEGLQYHLGDLRFANALPGEVMAFSESELRNAFPLREGDLFNVSLIRKGIEELTKLYGSQGYIDFTATPETEVDDQLQRISLVMRLDQEKQYRIRTTDVVGLDPGHEALLKSELKPGDIFNPKVVHDFYEENKTVLPLGISPTDLQIHRNQRDGTLDLFLNFLPIGVVEGVVLDSNGQPVTDASAYYRVGDDSTIGERHQTTTDCTGHFVLEHVLAGNVQIGAFKEADGYVDRRFAFPFYGEANDGGFPELQVRARETVKGVVVRLGSQGAFLELNVFDVDTKAPLDWFNYKLCNGDHPGDDNNCLGSGATGQRAQRIVPSVPITVKIVAPGYDSWNYKNDNTGSALVELHPGEVRSLTVYLRRNSKGNEQ